MFLRNKKSNAVFIKELIEGEKLIKDNPEVEEISQEEYAETQSRRDFAYQLSSSAPKKIVLYVPERDYQLFKSRVQSETGDVNKAILLLIENYGLGARLVMPGKKHEENQCVKDHR
jgi:hypothetical protein